MDAIMTQLYWFSGTSVRNAASLAGNIVTASPISDLNPVFIACDAKFKVWYLCFLRNVSKLIYFLFYLSYNL